MSTVVVVVVVVVVLVVGVIVVIEVVKRKSPRRVKKSREKSKKSSLLFLQLTCSLSVSLFKRSDYDVRGALDDCAAEGALVVSDEQFDARDEDGPRIVVRRASTATRTDDDDDGSFSASRLSSEKPKR